MMAAGDRLLTTRFGPPGPVPESQLQAHMTAYIAALRLLARRELSEAQVRQRLARRGYAEADVDEAIGKLKEERAIDDARVAEAIARTETSLKRRGRLRVKRQIQSAGV